MARSCIQTATIKRVKATTLIQAKRLVTEFYAIVDEFNETGDAKALLKFESLLTPVELPDGRRGTVFGGWDLHSLVITWIASLEKVRHDKSLFEPMIVSFNWNWHVVGEDGRESLIMKFDGVTFEPSDTDVVARRIGHTRDALAKRLGRDPARETSELDTNTAIFDKNTNWDDVQIDTERQLVIVTRPERDDTVIIDLRGSGFKICSDDAEARKSLHK
jgi:hypothetical protein